MALIDFIRNLLSPVGRALMWLFGLAPMATRLSRVAYEIILFVCIVLISIAIGRFNPFTSNQGGDLINRGWPGIAFFAGYCFIRFLLWFIATLFDQPEGEFDDIDDAWNAATIALGRKGIDLESVPIFLILGLDRSEKKFFNATQFDWTLTEPEDQSAPLHFYVSAQAGSALDAIYISCPGIGSWGAQLEQTPTIRRGEDGEFDAESLRGTLTPESSRKTHPRGMLKSLMSSIRASYRSEPRARYGQTIGAVTGTITPGYSQPEEDSMVAAPQIEVPALSRESRFLQMRRLEYLCQKLSAARNPWCPINGVVAAVPLQWAEHSNLAHLAVAVCDDFYTIYDTTGLSFPAIPVFTGLDQLPGFSEFLERGRKERQGFRTSRIGSRYPMGRPFDNKGAEWLIESGVSNVQLVVYELFGKDIANPQNRKLYQFLTDLLDRRNHMTAMLQEAFDTPRSGDPSELQVYLSGCYYAATGDDRKGQGFVDGVLGKLIDEQNEVSDSAERVVRIRSRRFWSRLLGTAAMLMFLIDLLLGFSVAVLVSN